MTPDQLHAALVEALKSIVGAGITPEGVLLRRPPRPADGDWLSTLALAAAPDCGADPRTLAEQIAASVRERAEIASVSVSGPGFLTVVLTSDALLRAVEGLLAAGDRVAVPAPATLRPPRGGTAVAGSPGARLGDDAANWHHARGSVGPPDFAALRRASPDNPLHLVQHAHAHGRRLLRRAHAAGIASHAAPSAAGLDQAERTLALDVSELDRTVRTRSARAIAEAAEALARDYGDWTRTHVLVPSIDDDITGLHAARLVLAAGVTTVLGRGLRQLGVRAPERM